ncbi:MAG: DNA cytosine methyltransferase, partial [Fusobacteriaceae bacterium]
MKYKIKFIDFCSGIGGGRLGLEKADPLFSCIGYSEIDKEAIKTYQVLHGKDEKNHGDLMEIDHSNLPNFELMIAGFPCQTFSVIGLRNGFNDERGKIIYGLLKILEAKSIPFFIFENVKGLSNHNNGESLSHITKELEKIGYHVEWKILNSINYGVPQMRERIYFVGIRQDIYNNGGKFSWDFNCTEKNVADFLIDTDNDILSTTDFTFQKYLNNQYNIGKFNLEEILN